MTKYAPNNLHELQHPYPKIPQKESQKWQRPNYGAKTQWSKEENSLEILQE